MYFGFGVGVGFGIGMQLLLSSFAFRRNRNCRNFGIGQNLHFGPSLLRAERSRDQPLVSLLQMLPAIGLKKNLAKRKTFFKQSFKQQHFSNLNNSFFKKKQVTKKCSKCCF
jgi:hypothetical protein